MEKRMIIFIVMFLFIQIVIAQQSIGDLGIVYIIDSDKYEAGFNQTLEEKDVLKFDRGTIDEGVYFYKLNTFNNSTYITEFILAGTEEKINLVIGETSNVDVNLDGVEDFSITYRGLINETVEVYIKDLGNKPLVNDIPVEQNIEAEDDFTNYLIYGAIGVIIIILLVVLIIVIVKTKKMKEPSDVDKEEKKKKRPVITRQVISEELAKKARNLIKIARKKGYDDLQIREIFENKGWEDKNIDIVFKPPKVKEATVGKVELKIGKNGRPLNGIPKIKPRLRPKLEPKPKTKLEPKFKAPKIHEDLQPAIQFIKKDYSVEPEEPKEQKEQKEEQKVQRPKEVGNVQLDMDKVREEIEQQKEETKTKVMEKKIEKKFEPKIKPKPKVEKEVEKKSDNMFEIARSLVEEARKKGISDEKIRKTFEKKGWDDSDIDKII